MKNTLGPLRLIYSSACLVLAAFLSSCSSSQSGTGSNLSRPILAPNYTHDIEIGNEVSGTASRSKLFGFIEWGANEYSSLNLDPVSLSIANQNLMTGKATGGAAFNALGGDRKAFLIEPRLTIKERDYWIFKKYEATVNARIANKSNFRQIKRYTTDQTETVPLQQEYQLFRGGKEGLRIVASNNLGSHVADTVRVVATDKDIGVLNLNASPSHAPMNSASSLDSLTERLQEIDRRILFLQKPGK